MRQVLIFVLVMSMGILNAQTAEEAIDMARFSPYGTTRAMSTMNTLDALGADMNAPNTNPAGLGNFRRSEFLISTSIEAVGAESSIVGSSNFQKTARSNAQLDQLGFVWARKPSGNTDWKQINFAFHRQKLDSYQKKFNINSTTEGSITQSFLEKANGKLEDEMNPFYEGLGYDLTLIVEDDPGIYSIDLPDDASIRKFDTYEVLGSKGSTNLSIGGNYQDKLLIGATLGFPSFRYNLSQDYNESDSDGDYDIFESLQYKVNGNYDGNGVNGRVGLIYNFNRALRIGFSTETPTRFSVDILSYTADLQYDYFVDGFNESVTELSPEQVTEYKMFTPWNHRLSIGSVIGRKGFISTVISYTDYTQLRYAFEDTPDDRIVQERENNRIDSLFSESINISVGGELALGQKVRLRAGLGYETSPYEAVQSDIIRFSGGIGWRKDDFYVDLGYLNESKEEKYSPYRTLEYEQTNTNQKIMNHRVSLTLGFKI